MKATPVAIAGLSGCLSGPASPDPSTDSSPRSRGDGTTTTGTRRDGGEPSVAALSVADFVLFPLAGVHPHVHRRADTQYVIVRMDTSLSFRTVHGGLTLTLDDEPQPLADRQPAPWLHGTVDLALAASKAESFDRGRVRFEREPLQSLSGSAIDRLNHPPVFEVSNPAISPGEVRAGERTTATVRFDLANAGEGRGTFGASVKGNFVSGATTVTATLESGSRREVSASVEIVGEGEEATVRLDWGSGEWSAGVPVVGTQTTTEASTGTPH